jgi:hypothetical protein
MQRQRGGATASRSSLYSFWYSWAGGRQYFSKAQNVNGWFAAQTNEQPYIDYTESLAGAHSLGQLWAIGENGAGCSSTAEIGWSESAGQFKDVNPHLFIYAFDCGVGLGYVGSSSIPWVQSSAVVFPNATLTHNDKFHVYGARMDGNNWWFYYDGHWVGYIPHEAWTKYFPAYITRGDVGGEVATPNYSTCSDMGYQGRYGWDGGAAMFGETWYEYNWNTASSYASLFSFASDPAQYVTGFWGGTPLHQFRYGGPGWC